MSPAPHPRMHGLTHVPGGPDPIPGLVTATTTSGLGAVILALEPAGFWKLNESVGSVAADSSGHDMHLSTTSPELDPLWGQAAGPPGEQAADFANGTGGVGGTAARVSRDWGTPIGDGASFTAGLWVYWDGTASTMLMGQGNPNRAGGSGWQLSLYQSGGAGWLALAWMDGLSGDLIDSTNPATPNQWMFLAMTYDHTAGICRLYMNGALEETSASFTFGEATHEQMWIGHDDSVGGVAVIPADFVGSYAFLIPRLLTDAELLAIHEAADIPTPEDGWVLTTDGAGGSSWQPRGVPDYTGAAEGDVLTIVGGVPTWQAP